MQAQNKAQAKEPRVPYGRQAKPVQGTWGIPTLQPGSAEKMLGEAVGQVKGLQGTAAQKADLFGGLAKQITQQSRGGWNAARGVRADGSHIQHFSLVG